MNNIDKNIGLWIKIHRVNKNLTQKALSQELGLTSQMIQKYESGASKITVNLLNQIALILDVEIENFLQPLKENEKIFLNTYKRPFKNNDNLDKKNIVVNKSNVCLEKMLLQGFKTIQSYELKYKLIQLIEVVTEFKYDQNGEF